MVLAEALRLSTGDRRSAEARARCMLKELRTKGVHFARLRTAGASSMAADGVQAAPARHDAGNVWW